MKALVGWKVFLRCQTPSAWTPRVLYLSSAFCCLSAEEEDDFYEKWVTPRAFSALFLPCVFFTWFEWPHYSFPLTSSLYLDVQSGWWQLIHQLLIRAVTISSLPEMWSDLNMQMCSAGVQTCQQRCNQGNFKMNFFFFLPVFAALCWKILS